MNSETNIFKKKPYLYKLLGSALSGGSSINDIFLINSKLSMLVLVTIGSLFFGFSCIILVDCAFLFKRGGCLFKMVVFLSALIS
jgi:hypothetical protein